MLTTKKIIFDVECMQHLFVLSAKLVDEWEGGETVSFAHPMSAWKFVTENMDALWVGYYSNGYDDYIISALIESCGEITAEELSDLSRSLIETENKRPRKKFLSYDVFDPIEAGMRSLKMYCGSSGRPTYDSPYSFKEDRHYNADEIEEIKRYCEEDVEWTWEVFQRERGFFEASMARLDILHDAGLDWDDNEARIVCCRSATFARFLFENLCDTRDVRDNYRTTIKFIHDLSNSKFPELREAYKFYADIAASEDEYTSSKDFYDKDKTPCFDNFTPECGINLGWGGAHGSINGYLFDKASNPKRALLYVDVSSMYPSLLVRHDLFPKTFSDDARSIYEYFYNARLTYKKNGEATKCAASKRVINSLTGMLKDQFASFRSEWSNNSIVVNGQLAILHMACLLRSVPTWKIVQVNTDGIMVEVNDKDADRAMFKKISDKWCEAWNFDVAAKEISTLVQTNVNNYYMTLVGHEDDEERKGAAYAFNEGYLRDKVAVKRLLPHCIAKGISAHDAIYNAIDEAESILDFIILIKITDTFPYLYNILNDEYNEKRCVRCIAIKSDAATYKECEFMGWTDSIVCYMKSREPNDHKLQKVSNFPIQALELEADVSNYNLSALKRIIDREYYVEQLQHAIDIFAKGE